MLLYWALYYVGNVLCFWVHPTINLIYMLMLGIYSTLPTSATTKHTPKPHKALYMRRVEILRQFYGRLDNVYAIFLISL